MILVGLCSTYKEGSLAREAVRSLLEACDRVLVMEGPAGDPITNERVPSTDIGNYDDVVSGKLDWRTGRWRTDARKRQAMLEWAQAIPRAEEETLWGVIVDGDEVLMNARFVRDWLQRLDWHEEVNEGTEYHGKPMRLVEMDGAVSWVRGRLLRLDRMREYKVSTSVWTAVVDGKLETYRGAGNELDLFSDWETPRRVYMEQDRMVYPPPFTLEPYLVHRSLLRHPLRSGLRMHEQEAAELAKAGIERSR